MQDKLAVSDANLGLLAILTLPDLMVAAKVRTPFRPGKLAGGRGLYCADQSEPCIYFINPETLEAIGSFPTAPEIEGLLLSQNGVSLYALSGGADSLQLLDAGQGRLRGVARVGMHPRAMALDPQGQCLAVACGGTCDILALNAHTLSVCGKYSVDGIATGCCFFAGQLMALVGTGDYEMGTVIGAIGPDGCFSPWIKLSGMPGAMTPCGGGLLVGHLQTLTMLDPPNGRIRWQTKIAGLPTEIVDLGRTACFADGLEGLISVVDLRRGTVLRRLQVKEPMGIALL